MTEYRIVKCGHGRHEIFGIDRPRVIDYANTLDFAISLAKVAFGNESEYQYNVFDSMDYRVFCIDINNQ